MSVDQNPKQLLLRERIRDGVLGNLVFVLSRMLLCTKVFPRIMASHIAEDVIKGCEFDLAHTLIELEERTREKLLTEDWTSLGLNSEEGLVGEFLLIRAWISPPEGARVQDQPLANLMSYLHWQDRQRIRDLIWKKIREHSLTKETTAPNQDEEIRLLLRMEVLISTPEE